MLQNIQFAYFPTIKTPALHHITKIPILLSLTHVSLRDFPNHSKFCRIFLRDHWISQNYYYFSIFYSREFCSLTRARKYIFIVKLVYKKIERWRWVIEFNVSECWRDFKVFASIMLHRDVTNACTQLEKYRWRLFRTWDIRSSFFPQVSFFSHRIGAPYGRLTARATRVWRAKFIQGPYLRRFTHGLLPASSINLAIMATQARSDKRLKN